MCHKCGALQPTIKKQLMAELASQKPAKQDRAPAGGTPPPGEATETGKESLEISAQIDKLQKWLDSVQAIDGCELTDEVVKPAKDKLAQLRAQRDEGKSLVQRIFANNQRLGKAQKKHDATGKKVDLAKQAVEAANRELAKAQEEQAKAQREVEDIHAAT